MIPNVKFPTQVTQAAAAIEYLLTMGVQPKDIQIVGDSAGANLALALLSHAIHPLDGVARFTLPSPIGGFYAMSPWVSLTGDTGSHSTNDGNDIMSAKTFAYTGRKVLAGVPESQLPYLEPGKTSDSWFAGIDQLIGRILITAGSNECLRDDIMKFAKQLTAHHGRVMFIMQDNGVHTDPFYDFLIPGEKNICSLTSRILEWLAEGFHEINLE